MRVPDGSGWYLLNLALCLALVASALSVIETSHLCRQMYSRLQALQAAQWDMQEQQGRLLLEQSTWATDARIESVSRTELHMIEPETRAVMLISK